MMWYWGGGLHWWGWLLGFAAMVVFWGLVIWAIWYFVTGLTRRPDHGQRPSDDQRPSEGQRPSDAQRILDERLARGEIDADEYRRLRDLLRGDDVPTGNGGTPVSSGAPDEHRG